MDNPIFNGALGYYNGCVLREAYDVTQGVANAGTQSTSVRRAVLLGAQACTIGYGQKDAPTKYRWNEELIDSSVVARAANDNRVNSGKLLAA